MDGSRVGLVLGAGGVAGGAFHAGVLAALAECGWDPRRASFIVGTSAGSITGTSLRAGLAARDILARATDQQLSAHGARVLARVGPPLAPPRLQRANLRARRPVEVAATLMRAAARPLAARPTAILAGLLPDGTIDTDFISQGIGGLFDDTWPREALWICAVRQRDGKRVVFGRDRVIAVADAVAASCAIPGFFKPVTIDGEAYVDGGAHSPTNADVLLESHCDLVIVSSPMSLAGRGVRFAADQAFRRWSRLLLDAEAVRLRRRGVHVVAFQPTPADAAVMGLNAMDPERRAAIAQQVFESTRLRLHRADTRARLAAILP